MEEDEKDPIEEINDRALEYILASLQSRFEEIDKMEDLSEEEKKEMKFNEAVERTRDEGKMLFARAFAIRDWRLKEDKKKEEKAKKEREERQKKEDEENNGEAE